MKSVCLKKNLSIQEQFSKIEKYFINCSFVNISIFDNVFFNVPSKNRFFYKNISKEIYDKLLLEIKNNSFSSLELKLMINSQLITNEPTIIKINNKKAINIFGLSLDLNNELKDEILFDTSILSVFGITTKTVNKNSFIFIENGYQIYLLKRSSIYSIFLLKLN
jgi:hypothetical protein